MIAKAKGRFIEAKPYLLMVWRQIWLPALIAVGYGLWDWSTSTGDFSLAEFFKVTFPALFFVMWFVGLYERAKKRDADSSSFEGLNSKVDNLTDLVGELRPTADAAARQRATSGAQFSSELIREAQTLHENGHVLASLLQAGVAFEQAVRSFARRGGLKEAEHMPLLSVLKKIDFLLPQGLEPEVHALRKIRNQLAHASEYELRDIGDTERILSNYEIVISILEAPRVAA